METLINKEKIKLEKFIETKCKELRFIYDFKKITGTFAKIKTKSIEEKIILLSVSYGYSYGHKEIYNGEIEYDRINCEEVRTVIFELIEKEPGEDEIITKFD